jgi:RNA methyltransferase, TrmH family
MVVLKGEPMIMSFKEIESRSNPTFQELLALKKGDSKTSRFLVEGDDLVDEADKAGVLKALIFALGTPSPSGDLPIFGLKEALYRELSSYQSLPKIMGICEQPYSKNIGRRVVYLDGVQDPGNAGTIIRTALSFGYSGVVLSKDAVSLYNSKVIQSTKGALFHIPVMREDLKTLKLLGYNIYVTTLEGEDEKKMGPLIEPFCLVFGNEGQGVRPENQKLGKALKIEMSGIDSLNVAVASGIFLYRFQK